MNTEIQQLQDNKVKVTVTVPAADVDKAIAATYKDFATRANIPGFRKGKIPQPVIDNAFGGKQAVMASVTEKVINDTYAKAADDADVFAVAAPQFDEAADLVVAGKDYTYTVEVEVEPVGTLTSYEPVTLALPSVEVTPEMVDMEIEGLRTHYATYAPAAEDAAVAAGDRVTFNLKAVTDGGTTIDAISKDGFVYTIGSGLLPASFDAKVIGMVAGKSKTFTLKNNEPATYLQNVPATAQTIKYTAKVVSITSKALPELTDEWAATLGMETVEALRERITEMLKEDREQSLPGLKEDMLCAELRKRLVGEPTAAMIDSQESDIMQNFFANLQNSGMTFDAFLSDQGITRDTFKEDVRKQAVDACKEQMALDAWARNLGIEINDVEVSYEFIKADPEHATELEANWRENGQLHVIRQGIKRQRALADALKTCIETPLVPAEEKKPAKKAAAKKSTKKAAEAPAETAEAPAAEEAPAKKPAKKSTKKAAAAEAPAEPAQE